MATYIKFAAPIVDESGLVIESVAVSVKDPSTSALISIYSDTAGTAESNPITTGADGLLEFYVNVETNPHIKMTAAKTDYDFTPFNELYDRWSMPGAGGALAFTDLTDVPSSYTGQAGKFLRVKSGELELEFATLAGGGDLLADGTIPLTANWDVGAYYIQALRFISDVATGTAPLTVASTTLVSNLNADLLDGSHAAAFALLAGRSGGQTLIGGTDSGDDLTLQTTSHGTKGSYILTDLVSDGLVKSTSGVLSTVTVTAQAESLLDDADAATMQSTLGLVLGTNVQAYSSQLAAIAALTPTDSNIIVGDGATWVTESGSTARTSLGLAIGSDVQGYHANLAAIAGGTWGGAASITTLGTVVTGTWSADTIGISKGGTGQTGKTAAFDALAPLTTKGDVIVFDGSDCIRVGVGSDGQVLTADAAAASGVKWDTAPGSVATLDEIGNVNAITEAQGMILYVGSDSKWAALAAGTSGFVLTTKGAGANPEWSAPTGGPSSGRHTETFSSQTQIVVTHNLGQYPVVQVYNASDELIVAEVTHDSVNQCTVDLSESMSGRIVCVSGGVVSFLELSDAPSSYSGAGGRYVKVNTGATALEFVSETHLLADGSQPLTANWDVGAYQLRAETFYSDVAIGTAPFTVTSTTVVTNLNADTVDGVHAASFALLAGRAGGQALIGGVNSGDDLTFQTTSDGTKGDYVFSEMTSAGFLKCTAAGIVTGGNAIAFTDLSAVSKDEDDMASDSDQHVPTQQSVKAYVDGLVASGGVSALDRDVTATTVSGTTAETTVYTYTVPGGSLSTNRMLRLTLLGYVTAYSASTQTLTVRVKYGGTTLFTYAAATAATTTDYALRVLSEISALNSASAQWATTECDRGYNASIAGTASGTTTRAIAGCPASVNSAADQTLTVTFQPSHTGLSALTKIVQVELI